MTARANARLVALLPAVLLATAGCSAGSSAGSSDRQAAVPEPPPASGASTGDGGPAARRLPYDYALVGPAGTTAYAAPPVQPVGAPGTHLGAGFGFVVTDERAVGGRRYVQIHDGRWLPAAGLTRARPSEFRGVLLAPGEPLRFGWVVAAQAIVRASPSLTAPAIGSRPNHARVILGDGPCRSGFCPVAAGWVRAADLAIPTGAARPTEVGPRDRWLDVDLAAQTLVAYQGDRPVLATLVSTGIGARGSPLATPVGVFRIRSKHALVRMDNLEHTGVVPYAYDVPLTQYFSDGKALHAAPWHDQFGHPRSHGCVNLAPRDAEWVFAFTAPALGPGTAEVDATARRPGTVVRVRGETPPVVALQ